MSLRSKVVGTLLGVFFLYVLAAWLVLVYIHAPAYNSLEKSNASDQLRRVQQVMDAERADVDLLVTDWAEWDDMMHFVLGENDEFYEENLVEGYLGTLGMSFGAIVDLQGRLVWGEAFVDDGSVTSLDYLFPGGFTQDSALLDTDDMHQHVSGLIDTAQGPAIVSSAAILWSNAQGPHGGHFIAGKLLHSNRMELMGQTMLSTIDLLPLNTEGLPAELMEGFIDLADGEKPYAIVKQGDTLHTLKILRDIQDQKLTLLRVSSQADISILGARTLRITILMLVVAALVLTLTLWMVLKGMLLLPIEHLTAVLRGVEDDRTPHDDEDDGYLHSTLKRLTSSRGLISQRNDEIGELVSAFDDLSSSLQDATTSVWRIAHLDGLTGLANRRLLMQRLTRAIVTSQGMQEIALLFIDLDDFKKVNDQLGHEAGDQLLIEAAARIKSAVGVDTHDTGPEDDEFRNLIARIGGDEFVVLLTADKPSVYADRICAAIVESVALPYSINDCECLIGACVGLAVYPDDAVDLNELLANADAAMYDAKRAGKNTWRRYEPDLSSCLQKKSA